MRDNKTNLIDKLHIETGFPFEEAKLLVGKTEKETEAHVNAVLDWYHSFRNKRKKI